MVASTLGGGQGVGDQRGLRKLCVVRRGWRGGRGRGWGTGTGTQNIALLRYSCQRAVCPQRDVYGRKVKARTHGPIGRVVAVPIRATYDLRDPHRDCWRRDFLFLLSLRDGQSLCCLVPGGALVVALVLLSVIDS